MLNDELIQTTIKEKIISINRVSKVVKGGKRIGFSVMVVVGDENGRVGGGLGKANEVAQAIAKGIYVAKKNMIEVPITDSGTIPFPVKGKEAATEVLLMPAPPGTGIIAGNVVRAVVSAAGIQNLRGKSLRKSNNPINVVYATLDALKKLKIIEEKIKYKEATI